MGRDGLATGQDERVPAPDPPTAGHPREPGAREPGPRSHRVALARPVAADEAGAVARLRTEALSEVAALRGGVLYAERDAPALPDAGDPDRPLWVGLVADAVVGYLGARVEDLPGGRHLGVVDAIYVDPACRAVGVGEAMMAAALDWFRARACVGVDAVALPGARATKNFFEESGFTSRLLLMHHPL